MDDFSDYCLENEEPMLLPVRFYLYNINRFEQMKLGTTGNLKNFIVENLRGMLS
jgi:hypothetical protein